MTFKDVMDKVLTRRGILPAGASETQMDMVADLITEHCQKAWEYDFWPEWTFLEERAYRPQYNVDAIYADGDEVWDGSEKYYESLSDGNQGNALTNATFWSEITDVDKYILLDQPGMTRIGAVKDIYRSENHAQKNIGPLEYYIDTDRIEITDSRAGATVWVLLRKKAPRFVKEDWVLGTAYAVGWVVYFPASNANQLQGECYMAMRNANNVEVWELMEVPEIFKSYIVKACHADYTATDGQLERAELMEDRAQAELERIHMVTFGQNGLSKKVRVVVS